MSYLEAFALGALIGALIGLVLGLIWVLSE